MSTPPPHGNSRRRLAAVAALALASSTLTIGIASYVDTERVKDNLFSAGAEFDITVKQVAGQSTRNGVHDPSLEVSWDGSTAGQNSDTNTAGIVRMNATNVLPGDTYIYPLTVENVGSLSGIYAMDPCDITLSAPSSLSGNDEGDASDSAGLTPSTMSPRVSIIDSSGNVISDSGADGCNFGDAATGFQTGDRNILVGMQEDLYVKVQFPVEGDQSTTGSSMSLSMTFRGEQATQGDALIGGALASDPPVVARIESFSDANGDGSINAGDTINYSYTVYNGTSDTMNNISMSSSVGTGVGGSGGGSISWGSYSTSIGAGGSYTFYGSYYVPSGDSYLLWPSVSHTFGYSWASCTTNCSQTIESNQYTPQVESTPLIGGASAGGVDTASLTFAEKSALRVSGNGYSTCVIQNAGEVWCAGYGQYGQLGHGSTGSSSTPVKVNGISNAVHIHASNQSRFAVLSDGTVVGWGRNNVGQLGDGTLVDKTSPVVISGLSGAQEISFGSDHILARMGDGTVISGGLAYDGQTGQGAYVSGTSPAPLAQVSGLNDVKQVLAHGPSSYAVTNSGQLFVWGNNNNGRLGLGDLLRRNVPTLVPGLSNVDRIAAAGGAVVVKLQSGNDYVGMGMASSGILTNSYSSDVLVPSPLPVLSGMADITCGNYVCAGLSPDGLWKGWGSNSSGQIGLGNKVSPITTPTTVGGMVGTDILLARSAGTVIVQQSGGLKFAGYNYYDGFSVGFNSYSVTTHTQSQLSIDVN